MITLLDKNRIIENEQTICYLLGLCLAKGGYDKSLVVKKYESLLVHISMQTAYLLSAWEEGQMVGLSWVYPYDAISGKELHVAYIAVAESWQKAGIGKELLDSVEKLAKEQGIKRLGLNVDADNTIARKFYQKNGFAEKTRYLQKEF